MMHTANHHANILIIDDVPENLDMLTRMLRKRDYRVRPAISGELALEAVQALLPDIILLDIMMPDIDGYEICRRLKADEHTQDIPVLFISALHREAEKVEAFQVGGVDYITKPFHTEEVLARVATHLALRNMQKQLQQQNRQLQQEIAERQKAEEERRHLEVQLHQKQKLEALGALAGGIAHDFNNILASILGGIELILSERYDIDEEKRHLKQVYRAGERAVDLVKQILLFSRTQERQLSLTDLSPLISETLDMLRATIPAHIEIRRHIQPMCPPIMADATQMNQVLVNLCVNAVHAMRETGGVLEVRISSINMQGYQNVDENHHDNLDLPIGRYVKLTISDAGEGISPDIQERIFEPFFTTKEIGEGSGLGLSVVQGIITGHHGVIHVESHPQKGTTFQIFFPVADEQNVQQKFQEPAKPVSKDEGSILIVEDEPALTTLYKHALTKLGYKVTTLNDGYKALELFKAKPDQFDLVFTDQAMPRMTGEQLSRELLHISPSLPIILTTGYSEIISKEKAKRIGIRQFLQKPVKIFTLVQSVREILSDHQSETPHD